jgi:hypothetical protein
MPAQITFFLDAAAGAPEAFRLVLADEQGKHCDPAEAHFFRRSDYAGRSWAYGRDRIVYDLPPGHYAWCASAGFEWTTTGGRFSVGGMRPIEITVRLSRIIDLAADGFICGDTHVHAWRGKNEPSLEVPFLAEGIDLAGAQCWGLYTAGETLGAPPAAPLFRCGRTWVSTDQEVEMHSPWGVWEDTTVMGLKAPLPNLRQGFGYRMNLPFYQAARAQGCAMIVYQAPTWAQFPVDVGLGMVDSVNICDNYFSITRPEEGPWDYTQFGGDDALQRQPRGIAHWIFNAWYRLLNAGAPLPCSGGSAYPGGGGGGPIGMNRFYIGADRAAGPQDWFTRWREGATFATNGPLLLAELDGCRPRVDFITPSATHRAVLRVVSNRPLSRLEWVADGTVIAERDCDEREYPAELLWETTLDLRQRSWVAVRAFGRSERALAGPAGWVSPPFLAAHSAPFYLENFVHSSEVRETAIHDIVERLEWMHRVLRGLAPAPFATQPVAEEPLGTEEREEALAYVAQATQHWQNQLA